MAGFVMSESFLAPLLFQGRLVVSESPEFRWTDAEQEAARSALQLAVADLPGPPLEGDLKTLGTAASLLYCIGQTFLHGDPADSERPALQMPHDPRNAWDHFSADLVLRFLPGVAVRIRNRDPRHPLFEASKRILLQWPFSGVLSDYTEPPTTPLDFSGHPGLGWIYGQRLAAHERQAWIPVGQLREQVEAAYHAMGRTLPEALPEKSE